MARIPATRENLNTIATKPVTRWLIQAAKDRSSLSYLAAVKRLESECSFGGISKFTPLMIGGSCGALMDMIHERFPDAPLLNVLMVNASDGYAGPGAAWYMARRFNDSRLDRRNIRETNKALWRKTADKAADEVYAYGDKWDAVFKKVFDEEWSPIPPRTGTEKDGNKYGQGGEGPNHKALRLWVKRHPGKIVGKRYRDFRSETEVLLDSADRVDVVYYGSKNTIALEVKSMDSNYDDLRRGVFQCIKYKAVMAAMDIRCKSTVEAILVTQNRLPGDLKAIAKKNDVKHFLAPKNLKAAAKARTTRR